VAQKVTTGVYRGVSTSELDNLAAETAASMTATHPDYALVSSRAEGLSQSFTDTAVSANALPLQATSA
jgi:hypothetical protein